MWWSSRVPVIHEFGLGCDFVYHCVLSCSKFQEHHQKWWAHELVEWLGGLIIGGPLLLIIGAQIILNSVLGYYWYYWYYCTGLG